MSALAIFFGNKCLLYHRLVSLAFIVLDYSLLIFAYDTSIRRYVVCIHVLKNGLNEFKLLTYNVNFEHATLR